jgi:hypothetical protein
MDEIAAAAITFAAADRGWVEIQPSPIQIGAIKQCEPSRIADSIWENAMRLCALAAAAASALLLLAITGVASAQTPTGLGVSGPLVHENLAVYFIHGKSAPGKIPLTLDEALARGVVQVRETGDVNQLEVENRGNDEVFVQSGDIVKGGRQDRTLMVSLVLPPHSGRIPIASFCVEQGRWTARGSEDPTKFATASASVPSRELKLSMKAPAPVPAGPNPARPGVSAPAVASVDTGRRQQEVWDAVRDTQARLNTSLGAQVRSAQSASSLQLALENDKLVNAQRSYVGAIKAAGEAEDDIVG